MVCGSRQVRTGSVIVSWILRPGGHTPRRHFRNFAGQIVPDCFVKSSGRSPKEIETHRGEVPTSEIEE